MVHKFVEGHPHCSSHLQVLPRALVTWYLNSSKDIHTVLVPFASSTEGAGHLVPKFVEGHPHCARPICKFYRGRWSLGTKIRRRTSTLLVPFPSSTEGAGHLVPKFVEGHPHCSSHFQVLPRALVTWYQNSSKDIHTARPISKFCRGRCTYRWLSRVNCAAYRIPPPLPQDRLTAQLVRTKVVTCWCAVKADPQDEAQLAGRPGQLAAQSRQGRVYGGRVSGCVTGRLGCVCSAPARNILLRKRSNILKRSTAYGAAIAGLSDMSYNSITKKYI
ncbi:hypothetical protein J6590_045413 [Homalodisca vitripennis]|nr:hypothetical protein J6590_045413 [Homalodisca vitripennis]